LNSASSAHETPNIRRWCYCPFCRFFPCIHNSSNSHNSIETASQLHRELTAEQIAALQQGSAAWHLGRSGHITGSTVTDLLGFDCPAINRLLAAHGVYHAVKDARQGIAKLQAATAKLRGEAAAAGTAHMGPFGMLCCEFGNRCGGTSEHNQPRHRFSCGCWYCCTRDQTYVQETGEFQVLSKCAPVPASAMDGPLVVDTWLLIHEIPTVDTWLQLGLAL
jgi:hypothetical protein